MKKANAFTLAEVLITLVIIGIVAAITVPTMITNSNERALKSALKKNHSVISQTLRNYYIDYGENISNDASSEISGNKFFTKYMNISQVIDSDDYLKDVKYTTYGGKELKAMQFFTKNNTVILTDGSMLARYGAGAGTNRGLIGVVVDVNGPFKKPNKLGRDTFFFTIFSVSPINNITIRDGAAIPGEPDEEYYGPLNNIFKCDKNDSSTIFNGFGCTAKVLQDKSY